VGGHASIRARTGRGWSGRGAGRYDDGLFAQYGGFDWTFTGEHKFFELDMTRQFAAPAPGQPLLRQVHCTFRFRTVR
jgi:hypothetical protein